jgi:hypothetical protein
VLTLPIFVAMLLLLGPSLRAVLDERTDRTTRLLLGGRLGVYAGWATAAVWINAATVARDLALDLTGAPRSVVLLAAVAGASISACLGTRRYAAQPAYVLAAAWALVGVMFSTTSERQVLLALIAGLGLLAVVAVAIRTRGQHARLASTA